MEKQITCISCPLGCFMTVSMENGNVVSVEGNTCPRGESYARMECVNPVRTVTSTVGIKGGKSRSFGAVPVKTAAPIPKDKIFDCTAKLKGIELETPVRIGDIVVKNICNTGVDIVATGNID